jgi:hypothetical protein
MLVIQPHDPIPLEGDFEARDANDHNPDPTLMPRQARSLITSVRVYRSPSHWRIAIWNRGGRAGELCVDAADGPGFLDLLLPPDTRLIGRAPSSLEELVR